jgi:hypothetical protein
MNFMATENDQESPPIETIVAMLERRSIQEKRIVLNVLARSAIGSGREQVAISGDDGQTVGYLVPATSSPLLTSLLVELPQRLANPGQTFTPAEALARAQQRANT